MGFDQTSLNTQLTAIQAAITAALASPRPDWQVGQVRMDQASYLKMLFEQQSEIIKQLQGVPAEVISTAHQGIDEFGVDYTQYVNEPVVP